jgi:hypothetical protein
MHSRSLELFNNRKETFMNKLIASLIVGAFSAAALASTPATSAVSSTSPVGASVNAKTDVKHSNVKPKPATKKAEAVK